MAALSGPGDWRGVIATASTRYRPAGRFARFFARGKLTFDPVFRHLIQAGLIPPHAHVLDIGCGQGLLASLLRSSAELDAQGRWPAGWAAAPIAARVTGIELMPREVDRARSALGGAADEFICGDMRRTPFPAADAVVLLDVLHYVTLAEQDELLARARQALPVGGCLLLRVGDATEQRRGRFAREVDRVVAYARRRRVVALACRPLDAWVRQLESLGFTVRSLPMSHGTPFANVLLVARVKASA